MADIVKRDNNIRRIRCVDAKDDFLVITDVEQSTNASGGKIVRTLEVHTDTHAQRRSDVDHTCFVVLDEPRVRELFNILAKWLHGHYLT